MMALGAGVVIPNVLRWYWWRMNGWGYALGTLGGILLSLIALFFKGMPVYYVFPLICLASLVVSIVASLVTPPVERDVLIRFYRSVRPFGCWKPIAAISSHELESKHEKVSLIFLNVVLGMIAITGLYLFPMYLVGHWYVRSVMWFILAGASIVILRYTWYPFLPAPSEEGRVE